MAVIIITTLAVAGAALFVRSRRPWESATVRAYRLCGECGISISALDQWIDDNAHSTLSRGESVELYLDTFEDRTEAEPCRPCVDAVLDAAALVATVVATGSSEQQCPSR